MGEVSNREWRTGDDSVEAMLTAFEANAAQLKPSLTGHWT